MKRLVLIFWILIMVVWPVSVDATENQKIIFSGSYSINNVVTDADSAWLYIFNNATLVDSTTVTAKDLQWDGCYQYIHQCTNDSTDGWTGWWVYFDESEAVSIGEWAIVATARDSSYALEASITVLRDTAQYLVTADTTGISENVADQIFEEAMATHNNYGTFGMIVNALGGVQALALAPGDHEQTTTRIALNLTATTDDLFNGCLINARSGVNAGRTVIITDYEAYSGDSGVVTVSPPLVLAATENQAFVITGAIHAVGDTINRAASVLVASDNIGMNADDVDGQFTFTNFELTYYLTIGYYNWLNATRTITGADDAFYEIVGDTIRPIFHDSIPALMDSIYRQMDSLYAIMDSLATQAWWSTSDCEGVGAYTCTLYVTDTLNDWRVPNVNVSINNQAEDAKPRVVQTNANGQIIVQYSNGDYRATCLNPMLRNNEGGSPFLDFTVDGAPFLDSLMGYLQSVGTPSSAEICSVYSWVYDVASTPVAGATIIFDLISDQDTLYYDNVMYVPGRTITESNSDGYWSIGVVPNEKLDTLSFYSVDIIRDHTRSPIQEHYDVYVPDSTTVILNDLLISFNRKGK